MIKILQVRTAEEITKLQAVMPLLEKAEIAKTKTFAKTGKKLTEVEGLLSTVLDRLDAIEAKLNL